MNIEDVRRITAIIETGSINKAAEQLFVTQPALSRSVRKIEEEFDITLFERMQGKKAVLTEEGEMFYQTAKELLFVQEKFVRQVEQYKKKDENRIILGMPPQQSVFLFAEVLQWLYLNAPGYRVETRSASSRQLVDDLLEGKVDCILISVSSFREELHYEKVHRLNTHLYLPAGSALVQKAQRREGLPAPVLRAKDLDGETVIVNRPGASSREFFERLKEKHGLRVTVVEEENMYQRMKLADEGVGTYVLSAQTGEQADWWNGDPDREVWVAPEDDVEIWRYLICRKGFEDTEKFRILLRYLKR